MKKLLDGAMGSMLLAMGLDNNEDTNILFYNEVKSIHTMYIDSGVDILSTNTFNCPKDYNLYYDSAIKGVQCALEAREAVGSNVAIAFDLGPTGKLVEPYGEMTEDECCSIYSKLGELAQSCDVILFETFYDLNELEIAIKAVKPYGKPIYACMTLVNNEYTLMHNSISDLIKKATELGVNAVGINCIAVENAKSISESLKKESKIPIIVTPNNGMPMIKDGKTFYVMEVDDYIKNIAAFCDDVDIIGGCCGTTPVHISKIDCKINRH